MTTLINEEPHFCKAKITCGSISTVCDNQCEKCKTITKDQEIMKT